MRKPICICGHFAFGEIKLNGQTIKTKIITKGIVDAFGESNVYYVDTGAGLKNLVKLPFRLFNAVRNCNHIVMMPAYKGVRVISALLFFLRLFGHPQVHYIVIGGWLARFMDDKPFLRYCLHKSVSFIYGETTVLREALRERGFCNVVVMPNFKDLKILSPETVANSVSEIPLKLCTFSRVMKQKGMEDAISAVRYVNEKMGEVVFDLTIYGPIWHTEIGWFEDLQKQFPNYVHYGGAVPFDNSVDVLKDYFALLFPTRFYTEGIPGTLIDAYAAGIPVISAKWESYADVVDDNLTGIGYSFGDVDALKEILLQVAKDPQSIIKLKKNCLKKAESYLPHNVMPILVDRLK